MTILLRIVGTLLLAALLVLGGYVAGRQYEADNSLPNKELDSSLFHYRKGKAHSAKAKEAARHLLAYLQKKSADGAAKALALYEALARVEEPGSEYASLRWFCEYFTAPESRKSAMTADKDAARMLRLFSRQDFAALKTFLCLQYGLSPEGKSAFELTQKLARLTEFLSWNCPTKKEWAQTDKLVAAIGLKRGDRIADIGCGYGYHTFRFSDAVGEEGCVYAVDPVKKHLKYIAQVKRGERIKNIRTVLSSPRETNLEESCIDCAFMYSTYHSLYAFSPDDEREAFIEGVKRALKKDGSLVVVDNVTAVKDERPYAGHRISPLPVIAQLRHYGFRLVGERSLIPQQYILVFRKM